MAQYIPPKNRDTRYALWFVRYECRVPYIQTRSIDELMEDGLPTSGDMHHDHAMQWEPRLMSLPIHRMAELWSAGANVALLKRDDAPKIYEAIMSHLLAWKEHIENAYHPRTPPYDDLLLLDQFANVVYSHARFAYDSKFITKHFKLSNSTAVGRRAMLAAMSKVEDKRRENADRGLLNVRNIDLTIVAPKYDPNAEATFVDYSGKSVEYDTPARQSMASFFKKGKK